MRISDWIADVCSSDLQAGKIEHPAPRVVSLVADRFHGNDGLLSGLLPHPFSHPPAQPVLVRLGPLLIERDVEMKSAVEGKRVAVRVDHGGLRIINKNKQNVQE